MSRVARWVLTAGLAAAAGGFGWQATALGTRASADRAAAADAARLADSLAAHAAVTRDRVLAERLREEARRTPGLLLAVERDSGIATLVRDGLPLRRMPIEVGPGVNGAAVSRGAYPVVALLGPRDTVELPPAAWSGRGEAVPEVRRGRGLLGPVPVRLQDGPYLYSRPAEGPLADEAALLPGSLRLAEADLRVLRPNLKPGVPVYIF